MSKLSVFELSRRLKRLEEIGEIIGFDVVNCDDHMEWSSEHGGQYCIFPYSEMSEMPQFSGLDMPMIPVCISDDDMCIENSVYLNELEILVEFINKNNTQDDRLLLYWRLMYGKKNINDLMSLLLEDKKKGEASIKSGSEKKKAKTVDRDKEKMTYDFNYLISQSIDRELISIGHKFYEESVTQSVYLELLSKVYPRAKGVSEYWYSVHSYQIEKMKEYSAGYYMFCMSECKAVLSMSREFFNQIKDNLTTSPNNGNMYWHIKIFEKDNKFWLQTKNGKLEITSRVDGLRIISETKHEDISEDVILIRKDKIKEVSIRHK